MPLKSRTFAAKSAIKNWESKDQEMWKMFVLKKQCWKEWNVLHAKNSQSWQEAHEGNLWHLFKVINKSTKTALYVFTLNTLNNPRSVLNTNFWQIWNFGSFRFFKSSFYDSICNQSEWIEVCIRTFEKKQTKKWALGRKP